MKKKKINFLCVFLIVIVGFSLGLGIYFFSKKSGHTISVYDYLTFNQNRDAILRGVDENFPIEVIVEDDFTYQVLDSNDKEVETILKKKQDYAVILPKGSYQKGETYVVTIQNGSFREEQLEGLSSLTFTVKRDKVERIIYKDNVKEVDSVVVNNNKVQTDEHYQVGDILLINNKEAYRIDKVSENGLYEVSIPEIEELYSDLDVYLDDEISIKDIVTTDEFREYLAYEVSQTAWYQKLLTTVDAAPKIQVKIDTTKKKTVTVSITVILPAKDENSFIKPLDNHNLSIKIEFEIENIERTVDMSLRRQDAVFTLKLKNTTDVSIDFLNASFDNFAKSDKDILDDFTTIYEYKKLIKERKADKDSVTSTIGGVNVPIGTTGLTFQFNFGLLLDYEMKLDAGYKVTQEQIINIGFHHEFLKEFEIEGNTNSNIIDKSAYIAGEAEVKVGLELETGFSLFNIADGSLVVDGGLYGTAKLEFSVSDILEEETYSIDAEGEIGMFIDATIEFEVLKNTAAEWKFFEKKWKIDEYKKTFSNVTEAANIENPFEDDTEGVVNELDPNLVLSQEIQDSLQAGFKKYMENDYQVFHAEEYPSYVFKGLRIYWDPCNVNDGILCYGSEFHGSAGTTYAEGFAILPEVNVIKYIRHYAVISNGGNYYPYYSCSYNYLSKEVNCENIDYIKKLVFDACTNIYQYYDPSSGPYDGYGTDFMDVEGCVSYLMGEEVKSQSFYQPIFNKVLKYANLKEKDLSR